MPSTLICVEDFYFFTTVNDYDFRENRNEAAAAAAIKWAEQFASMHCEYEGKDVVPTPIREF